MKTVKINMVKTGYISPDNRVEYRVPESYDGKIISRSLGRLCSGDTILPIPGSPTPQVELTMLFSDGQPYYIGVSF